MVFTATHILWVVALSCFFFLLFGVFIGLIICGKFDIALKVGARNQMEFYAKAMNKALSAEQEKEGYKTDEMFPPTLGKDFGVPRELK